MEDRATLRISSQHIANWLHHGIVTPRAGHRDLHAHGRGGGPPERRRPDLPPHGAVPRRHRLPGRLDLVFKGREAPNGYTEPTLHRRRRELKQMLAKGGGHLATG